MNDKTQRAVFHNTNRGLYEQIGNIQYIVEHCQMSYFV